jgi:hypothetical protein
MARRKIEITGELPAGDYYIGDPCYAIPDAKWNAFLEIMWKAKGHGRTPALFEFEGHKCFVSSTNTGDGDYHDQHGNEYGVDSGLLGAIPAALCGGYSSHTFTEPFPVGADPGCWIRCKRIHIGNIEIKT